VTEGSDAPTGYGSGRTRWSRSPSAHACGLTEEGVVAAEEGVVVTEEGIVATEEGVVATEEALGRAISSSDAAQTSAPATNWWSGPTENRTSASE